MDSVENVRIGQEGAKAGLGAQIDPAAPIFDAREIGRIRIAENPSTEGDEA